MASREKASVISRTAVSPLSGYARKLSVDPLLFIEWLATLDVV
jgi:hypothetical protein